MLIIYFFKSPKILGLIRKLTYSFSTINSLLLLYVTLVRPVLEYASTVWNSVTATDTNKLERVQRKFASHASSIFSLLWITIILMHLRL